MAAVLREAQYEASDWGLHHVEIWNPDAITLNAARELVPDLEVEHREIEGIASLQCHGHANAAREVEWMANEKYGSWF